MSESARITQQELKPLPRRARLAFAARCLRRAHPLLHASEDQRRTLGSALERLDRAARGACSDEELTDAAAAAYTLALDNLDHKDPSPTAEDHAVATCMAAHATAFAAEAATLVDALQAAHLVAQSVDFAVHAFRMARPAEAGRAVAAMRADLRVLAEVARREGWGEESPVGAEVFGPL
jgi:hypothetical protein